MKNIIAGIMVAMFVALAIGGCEKRVEEESVVPLEIDFKRRVMINDYGYPVRKIRILSGNGGYYIVYPKQVDVGTFANGSSITRNYEDDMYSVSIDAQKNIVIERGKWFSDTNDHRWILSTVFMVCDAKGERRIFDVASHPYTGGLETPDSVWKELEQKLINDPGYWQ